MDLDRSSYTVHWAPCKPKHRPLAHKARIFKWQSRAGSQRGPLGPAPVPAPWRLTWVWSQAGAPGASVRV